MRLVGAVGRGIFSMLCICILKCINPIFSGIDGGFDLEHAC